MCEQKARQIVDLEAVLVAVLTHQALVGSRAEAGVVDEHVEPVVVAQDRLGEISYLVERGEIRGVKTRTALAFSLDLGDKSHPPLAITAVDDDVGAQRRESPSHLAT